MEKHRKQRMVLQYVSMYSNKGFHCDSCKQRLDMSNKNKTKKDIGNIFLQYLLTDEVKCVNN